MRWKGCSANYNSKMLSGLVPSVNRYHHVQDKDVMCRDFPSVQERAVLPEGITWDAVNTLQLRCGAKHIASCCYAAACQITHLTPAGSHKELST